MNFVPSSVKAEEWGISQRRVAILCKEGRVPGAELIGNRWFLPVDAMKPEDPRKARKNETTFFGAVRACRCRRRYPLQPVADVF